MYERITKLLETELLRISGDEQNSLTEECKENLSMSPSVPITRPETSVTEKTVSEQSVLSANQPPPEQFSDTTKSSSTRPGRSTIVYDEAGNQWDSEELEKKEKNPYRWFIEKQREKQNAKSLTRDEEATTAMVIFRFEHSFLILFD
jgi:hypothetical protein